MECRDAYDGMGRRVESIESSTTFYAYLGTETLYENVVGGATSDYVFSGPLRIAKVSGSTVNYYHPDALGSTRLVTTTGKKGVTVAFADNYQPYGQDNGTPTGSETYKYTGKPYSQATGLYYYYQRWYDASIGRFVSRDPLVGQLSDPESLNSYAYAGSDPISHSDPRGTDTCDPLNPFTWGGCVNNGIHAVGSGVQTVGNAISQGVQAAGNALSNVHIGGIGSSLSKSGDQIVSDLSNGLHTLGNIYWTNTVNTANALWNGLNVFGNMLYFSYVTGPSQGWNSPNTAVRTYYRCQVAGAITAVAAVGGYYALGVIDWATVYWALRAGTVTIPRLLPIAGLLPIWGYYPGLGELVHVAWEVGKDAYIGCATGLASYL